MAAIFDPQRTFQSHAYRTITKGTEVVLPKHTLRRIRYRLVKGVSVVLNMHLDVSQELVIFGKHSDDRDLKLLC